MSDQTAVVVKSARWSGIGILLFGIVFVGVGAGAYYQLWQTNAALTHTVAQLNAKTADTQNKLVGLAQSLEALSRATVKQDQATTILYQQLMTVDEQLDQLPLLVTERAPSVMPALNSSVSSTPTVSSSWWRAAWNRMMDALHKLVVVRHIGMNAQPIVAPDEKLFLYQNLHAQMTAAIWGDLHHNSVVYQTSLKRVVAWITLYFVQDAPQTKNVLMMLAELQKIDVAAATP